MRCSFSSEPLDLPKMTPLDRFAVQCPVCGAIRGAIITCIGLAFPRHQMLDASPKDRACWKKRDGRWEWHYWMPEK